MNCNCSCEPRKDQEPLDVTNVWLKPAVADRLPGVYRPPQSRESDRGHSGECSSYYGYIVGVESCMPNGSGGSVKAGKGRIYEVSIRRELAQHAVHQDVIVLRWIESSSLSLHAFISEGPTIVKVLARWHEESYSES